MRTTLGDKILIVCFIFLNVFLFIKMGNGTAGDWVVIEVDQREVSRYPLSDDRVVPVKGRLGITQVKIEKGKARILHSPCKNKICIKSGDIQYADRLIACLPNRVVVRVIGKNQRGVDAVVG
ncbi:MAG: hypothetical protein NPINA01_05160 [Nitrospinaceae bacterium]|nr:MAG: hypothetical protein NPINA01_05160 [Nitrospinaceae bacterium]